MKTTFRGWTPSILVGTTASGTGITSACAVADRAIATKIHLPIRQYLLVSHSGLSLCLDRAPALSHNLFDDFSAD